MIDALPLSGRARRDRTPHDLAAWRDVGGYQAVGAALEMGVDAVRDAVEEANLNGRGGAGFPTARKWRFMPPAGGGHGDGPSYLLVNGDEMEPGAFKDRFLLEAMPHQLVEGATIAAFACHASEVIVLIRDSYRRGIEAMRRAIAEAEDAGLLGRDILGSGYHLRMRVHASAGRYIVGEETALIEAIEGHRAVPRKRPPFPAQSGLWGRPTIVNNVETLSCVPHIIVNGASWFRGLSRTQEGGTKLFGISGRVRRPQLIEAPMGTTARELIDRCGGVAGDGHLRCFQPGGGASGFLEKDALDVPLDFAHVTAAGSSFGVGGLIVLDGSVCPIGLLARHQRFYARESCGWCTPCRDGLPWVTRVLEALEAGTAVRPDLDVLHMAAHEAGPRGRTFCDLMGGAMASLATALDRWPELFEAHLDGGCPLAHRGAA